MNRGRENVGTTTQKSKLVQLGAFFQQCFGRIYQSFLPTLCSATEVRVQKCLGAEKPEVQHWVWSFTTYVFP